ncbi:hypothetical protein GCM10011390_33620 [Aureimonas endophytica]|uniref:histidine kinase n=1 Tax=Aureimonas endophytica TaxID=2027858 RepID=A0A917E7U8_9HYPH|nr:ATP-binding protein [Aureimonas endophytica]GGE11785.1 hypothetical protein GCM10011390_33620 [Aureimonas endophytica]
MPLHYRLSLIFAGFATALVVVLGWFVQDVGSRALTSSVMSQLSQAAHQMSGRLDTHMFERQSEIMRAAAVPELFHSDRTAAQRTYLEGLQAANPTYAWIGFAGTDGHVIAATGQLLEGVDVSARPWFQAGLAAPSGLDVHEAKLLQKYLAPPGAPPLRFVDVVAPVRDASGQLFGVIGGHLSWSWADEVRADVLATLSELENSELLVTSSAGVVLLGPPAEIGTTLDLASPDYVQVVSRAVGYRSFPGLGWSVVARQPVADAFAPITRLTRAIATAGVMLLIASAVAGWLIALRITDPLRELVHKAMRVQDDEDISKLPRSKGYPEVETLSAALFAAFQRQRRTADALRATNATLEERVVQRTRQVEEALNRAEEAARAKGEFLATMSHELRSPLNGIMGFAEILLDEEDMSPAAERRLLLIRNAGQGLKMIIDDVLDVSKIEAGKLELVRRPFRLDALLDGCVGLLEAQAMEADVALSFDRAPSLPDLVEGDEARLRQVILNLLSNAVKFSRGGQVSLAAYRREADPASMVTIAVSDTGIGMSREQLDRLFNRFTQADSTISLQYGGTGLGLSIAQDLVRLMGGLICVESAPGRGSTFRFTVELPAAEGLSDCRSLVPLPERRTGRILLVEDIAINREVATVLLERAGHSVATVEDGYEALAALERHEFDLVLMDIQMPGLDGRQTARLIRENAALPKDLPILALTANVLPEEVASFAPAGIDDFIAKPIDRETLYAKIGQWLARGAACPAGGETEGRRFDRATFEELVELLGPVRTATCLRTLLGGIAELQLAFDTGADLAATAHKIVSMAGTLGFFELGRLCAVLEGEAKRGADLTETIQALAAAIARCLALAARLLPRLEAGPSREDEAPEAVGAS